MVRTMHTVHFGVTFYSDFNLIYVLKISYMNFTFHPVNVQSSFNPGKVAAAHSPDSFQCIFWEQQRQASSLKKARSMKWHPLMIRWCLYLGHLSGGAYETLCETGVIKLPSQRTLRDYTYYTAAALASLMMWTSS